MKAPSLTTSSKGGGGCSNKSVPKVRWLLMFLCLYFVMRNFEWKYKNGIYYYDDDGHTIRNTTTTQQQQQQKQYNNTTEYLNVLRSYYDGYNPFLATTTTIRSWGCHRTETPFIFVHIGKAGGGTVRRRVAASSLNYTQKGPREWFQDSTHYYPIAKHPYDDNNNNTILPNHHPTTHYYHGKFCNGKYPNFRPRPTIKTFEGTWQCTAHTPIGNAIACNVNSMLNKNRCCDPLLEVCPIVFAGHNMFGNEMHWLPPPYLHTWWMAATANHWHTNNSSSTYVSEPTKNNGNVSSWDISFQFQRMNRNEAQCPFRKRGKTRIDIGYENCRKEMEPFVDARARQEFVSILDTPNKTTDSNNATVDWWKIYASLPVLRVTVMREPFSWLLSKFQWHGLKRSTNCSDIYNATTSHVLPQYVGDELGWGIGSSSAVAGGGWARHMALEYIAYICGEDCINRYHANVSTIVDLEKQADGNLRHGFAVVGLLNESETFYDMVNARVSYLNMTAANVHYPPETTNKKLHSSGKKDPICEALYKDEEFQKKLMEASPEIAAIQRLYRTAVAVNRFQLDEMTRLKCL